MTNPNSAENLDGRKWSESNWEEDYLNTKQRLSQFQIKLLKEGPSSFSGSLYLGVIKRQWLKMRGLYTPEPEPPNCQSSFSEWNNNAKQLEQNNE
ncbi:hypothetical protein [Prochlorococcus sp. MIT 1011]|uniref:hypothetical protein n=1 Tax=Prochlorococcus sp. MIT 1011 TaxID=3082520 RepID=UPI0039B660B4